MYKIQQQKYSASSLQLRVKGGQKSESSSWCNLSELLKAKQQKQESSSCYDWHVGNSAKKV